VAASFYGFKNFLPCDHSFKLLLWPRAMLHYITTGLVHDYTEMWATRQDSLLPPSEMIAQRMFVEFEEAIYELAQKHGFKDGMKLYWHAYLNRVGKCTKRDDSASMVMRLAFERVFPNAKDMTQPQTYTEFVLRTIAPNDGVNFYAECAEMAYSMVVDAYLERGLGDEWKPNALISLHGSPMDCTGKLFEYGGELLK